MTVEKFKNQLTHDTSVYELREYVAGKKQIDLRIGTYEEKEELLKVFIPALIILQEKENAEDIKYWYNAPLFRLAFHYCLQTRRPKSDLFDVAVEIVRRTSNSKHSYLASKYTEYYNRTIGVEII